MIRLREFGMRAVVTGLLGMMLAGSAFATPYVPREQAEAEANVRAARTTVGPQRVPGELDEYDGYVYPVEYMGTLDWLTNFQVTEAGTDFGGQREGESNSNWTIIQTDNTQEAIRDWSFYGRMTGDTATYHEYIENAWVYTLNHPAYLEEGGGNPNYYRVHNSGWGLVATMEYTLTYGENADYLAYGDSCASYIDNWRLTWTGSGVELNPLSAGYGAGALYLYGVWRGNQDWIDAAQEIANDVKDWIDADPDRLNSNETWAMSGGTAMWGVVTALYSDDPEGGAAWIPTVSGSMDTYSGAGNWNNSWTIWYGHAWAAIHRVLGDQESYDNTQEVVDYMEEQVHLDDDYGVPGTQNNWADDQSWTSAYLIWYGLESIMEFDDIQHDAVAYDVVEPLPSWPMISGNPVEFTVQVANAGSAPLASPDNAVSVQLQASGETFTSATVDVPFGQVATVTLPDAWTPSEAGEATIQLIVSTPNDERTSNDTLEVVYNVQQGREISGQVVDEQGQPMEAEIAWLQTDVDPPRSGSVMSDPETGDFSIYNTPGDYELTMTPVDVPYLGATESVVVEDSDVTGVDFTAVRAEVMLVSEASDIDMDYFIGQSLIAGGYPPYKWSIPDRGQPGDTLSTVSVVVWSTGRLTENVLDGSQYDAIDSFTQGGGGLLLTGDGALNGGDPDILSDLLGAEVGLEDFSSSIAVGNPANVLALGDSLFLLGVTSTQNMDEIMPVNGAEAAYYDQSNTRPIVTTFAPEDRDGRAVVASFGLDAINSSSDRFRTRNYFIRQAVAYLGLGVLGVEEETPGVLPQAWSLAAHPNPFNPSLTIEVKGGSQAATLSVYDLLGRQVAHWAIPGGGKRVVWQANDVASGTYFLRLDGGTSSLVRRVTLLR